MLLIGGAAIAALLAAALAVALVVPGDGARVVPEVRSHSLVRIDPATNAVSAVTDVGFDPMAAAAGGRSVWVYNRFGETVSEIDAETNEVRMTTDVSAQPVDLSLLTGPVLAADDDGVWLVGVDARGKSLLTRVLSGVGEAHDYLLDRVPRAVAVGEGAVWVLGAGKRDFEVLRVDPATGRVTARTRFPASSRVTSLDVGLGAVWVVSSSSATLYRINPRSAAVTGRTDLGQRAGLPEVQFGAVWVAVSDAGGQTLLVDPRSLIVYLHLSCCAPGEQDDVDGFGSDWTLDWPSGRVVRWDPATYQPVDTIAVTDPPRFGGLCLTSIAAGAGAVWVTVAPPRAAIRVVARRLPPQRNLSLASAPTATLLECVIEREESHEREADSAGGSHGGGHADVRCRGRR